jgi:hypothetical protein
VVAQAAKGEVQVANIKAINKCFDSNKEKARSGGLSASKAAGRNSGGTSQVGKHGRNSQVKYSRARWRSSLLWFVTNKLRNKQRIERTSAKAVAR